MVTSIKHRIGLTYLSFRYVLKTNRNEIFVRLKCVKYHISFYNTLQSFRSFSTAILDRDGVVVKFNMADLYDFR